MPGTVRSALMVVLVWMAIGVCVTELFERRDSVLVMVAESSISLVSGVMSYVPAGLDN